MSHTPGPWKFSRRGADRYIRDASGESLFCDTQYYPWCSSNEADWPLIAAAPELLEALKRMERIVTELYLGGEEPDEEHITEYEAVWKATRGARSAIDKAEGRQ